MKKKMAVVTALLSLVIVLSLSGCGSSNNSGNTGSGVQDGIDQMLASVADLTEQVKNNQADKAKELGEKLEEEWSSFEDDVKADHPDSYEEVEKYLDPLIAGSAKDPLDADALNKLADSLKQALQTLKDAETK